MSRTFPTPFVATAVLVVAAASLGLDARADETRPDAPAPLASVDAAPASAASRPLTLDVLGSRGWLSGGQPDAHALDVRGVWDRPNGDTVSGELLDETKFGKHGGIVAASYSRVLSADWIVAGSLAFGHGGPNWANNRADVEVTTKWFEAREILTRVAAYHATYDGNRSDSGGRISLVAYLPGRFVVEGGGLYNVSQPSSVRSGQGFASITWGTVGDQYVSARYSGGTEAYQAVGDGRQLVGFHSRSVGASWRRWISRGWGVTIAGEHYSNPSYQRNTLGLGVFAQW